MNVGAKRIDKVYAGMVGGVGVLLGFFILQNILLEFNLQDDWLIVLLGLLFLLGGAYWILNTYTRKLTLEPNYLIRKNAFSTEYILDLQQIRGLGNLKYSTKGFSKKPYKVKSIDILLDTGNTQTINLDGLSPNKTIHILEQVGKRIDPNFQFQFQ